MARSWFGAISDATTSVEIGAISLLRYLPDSSLVPGQRVTIKGIRIFPMDSKIMTSLLVVRM